MATNGSPGGDSGLLRVNAWRRRWAICVIVGLVATAGGAVKFWWQPAPAPPINAVTNKDEDIDEPEAPNPGYLGPQACVACHAKRVTEFQETSHFRACRLPEADSMPPGFSPDKATYSARDSALRFEMTRINDDFFQTAIHTTPQGERRTSSRIALMYGTGTADEVFFTWHGDHLVELPIAWLDPLKRWGEQRFTPYGSGDFSRTATPRCLECHNTWFQHVAGTKNRYKTDHFILGVTCEKCHGPGRDHVAFHEAHPESHTAHDVVQPDRLTRDRQMDLCAQCHGNAVKRRGPAFSYRPGEPLDAFFKTSVSKFPENDHVANQVEYLRQSKCFLKSDKLTCITCHNPHRPKSPANSASVQRACHKCHQPKDCREQDRLPVAVRANCVGCHMPKYSRVQVFFHTEEEQYLPPIRAHQHRIAIYPTARQEILLAFHRDQSDPTGRQETARLTKALVEHWLAEAETFGREYRFLAQIGALREAIRLDPAPATLAKLREAIKIQAKLEADFLKAQRQIGERRFNEAIETLKAILAVKPDWAEVHGKLGTVYAIKEQNELAIEHLQAVAKYDPDDQYGFAMLGWLAYRQDKAEDALDAYRRADEIEPYDAELNYKMGLALAKLGRWPEAIVTFRKVVTIDPNHAGGCQCLGDVLRRQDQPEEALRYALRAARLTQFENSDVLLTLAKTYADASRFEDAEDTAAKALDLARKTDPNLAPEIRRLMEEIRQRGAKNRK